MCGRYVSPGEAALNREYLIDRTNSHLRAVDELASAYLGSFNVAPSQQVPILRVIRDSDAQREAVRMRWGLIPWWSNGQPTKYSTINCRIESMQTNASYRDAWQRGQRCVFPASGFYEWHLNPDGTKQPYYIRPIEEDTTFPLAGLWDRSITPTGEVILSCTIITMDANELMAEIHNDKKRMPAILHKEDVQAWLTGTPEQAHAVLRQYPSDQMLAFPVSRQVNAPQNDGPELIQAVDSREVAAAKRPEPRQAQLFKKS